MIVKDDIAVNRMFREPGGDLIAPGATLPIGGGLVDDATREPGLIEHLLQLGDRLSEPP